MDPDRAVAAQPRLHADRDRPVAPPGPSRYSCLGPGRRSDRQFVNQACRARFRRGGYRNEATYAPGPRQQWEQTRPETVEEAAADDRRRAAAKSHR